MLNATNATKLGGYASTDFVRTENGITTDVSGITLNGYVLTIEE